MSIIRGNWGVRGTRGARASLAAASAVAALVLTVTGCEEEEAGSGGGESGALPGGEGGGSEESAGGEPNGIQDKPAAEIAQTTVDALHSAQSVRLTGDVATDLAADLHFDNDGNCTGTVEASGEQPGSFAITRIGDEVWIQPDADAWQQIVPGAEGQTAAQEWEGMYIHTTADEQRFSNMSSMCSKTDFFGQWQQPDSAEILEETEYNGVPAVTIEEVTQGTRQTTTVSTVGEPVPLRIEFDGPAFDLTDYNTPVEAEEPPADQIVESSEIPAP